MNTMQPKKSQTTQNQSLWTELSDDVAAQLSGGEGAGCLCPRTGKDKIVLQTPGEILQDGLKL
ncbi:MAG: hypothetical protein AB1589_36050 [Cyanobacteriota bacterium]